MLALAGSSIALAACSSSSSGPSASSEVAKAALIRASDLPVGYEQGKASKGNDARTAALAAKIPACADYAAQAKVDKLQDVREFSHDFSDLTTTQAGTGATSPNTVANQVVGYASADDAKNAYEVYASSAGETCMRKVFAKVADEAARQLSTQSSGLNLEVRSTLERVAVPPAGDANAAFGINLVVRANGKDLQQLAFMYEVVRQGPYLVSYNATIYHQPPKHWGTRMVDSSIARLEAAMGTGGAKG